MEEEPDPSPSLLGGRSSGLFSWQERQAVGLEWGGAAWILNWGGGGRAPRGSESRPHCLWWVDWRCHRPCRADSTESCPCRVSQVRMIGGCRLWPSMLSRCRWAWVNPSQRMALPFPDPHPGGGPLPVPSSLGLISQRGLSGHMAQCCPPSRGVPGSPAREGFQLPVAG